MSLLWSSNIQWLIALQNDIINGKVNGVVSMQKEQMILYNQILLWLIIKVICMDGYVL